MQYQIRRTETRKEEVYAVHILGAYDRNTAAADKYNEIILPNTDTLDTDLILYPYK